MGVTASYCISNRLSTAISNTPSLGQLHGDCQSSQQYTDGTRWQECAWLQAEHQTGKIRNNMARSRNHRCSVKPINIPCSECVSVALGIHIAKHKRSVAICGLSRSTIFIPHYLINGTIFGEKLLNTKCVLSFSLQLLSETFLILRRNERDIIKNVYRSSCKVLVIVVRF